MDTPTYLGTKAFRSSDIRVHTNCQWLLRTPQMKKFCAVGVEPLRYFDFERDSKYIVKSSDRPVSQNMRCLGTSRKLIHRSRWYVVKSKINCVSNTTNLRLYDRY